MDKGNVLEGGTYEVLRSRLGQGITQLATALGKLNEARRENFGGIEQKLLATERINTDHNCIPQDMIAIGDGLLFGFNVQMGLKSQVELADVFSMHTYRDHAFSAGSLELISDPQFEDDFFKLYKYYKETSFARFSQKGPYLYMIFRIGKDVTDIKAFKWQIDGSKLTYLDNRSEHEFAYPPQHDFTWKRVTRDDQRQGKHPHVSIADEVFVETVGGDLTIKIEDNTETGQGIYREEVENKDQTLDDAEIFYAIYGSLILLKIRPYQEEDFRYIVYNKKIREARRIPSIKNASIFLPDDQGIIFSNGYYLQSGDYKLLDSNEESLLYEKTIVSPNGEDYLYLFYQPQEGRYVLLPFNIIRRSVLTPIHCHGYALYENGELAYFFADEMPKKHHVVKIWQTPFTGADFVTQAGNSSYLSKIGNKEIVQVMAECQEILTLSEKGENYDGLYNDLRLAANDLLDSYHWLSHEEAFRISEPLTGIRDTAEAAIAEYEKVLRIRKETAGKVGDAVDRAEKHIGLTSREASHTLKGYVDNLALYRRLLGEIEELKKLRYADQVQIDEIVVRLREENEKYAAGCVRFLLRKEALAPFDQRIAETGEAIGKVKKVAEADEVEAGITALSAELELLIDVVGNLKIRDATETTRIVENISGLFARVNQRRAELRKVRKQLTYSESVAEFSVQMNLLEQGLTNYIDLSDTPQKTEEYLAKLMIQLEELEGRFAEYDEFRDRISERRELILDAFESRKVMLNEQLNQQRQSLLQSGERIIQSMHNRVMKMKDATSIASYFTTDIMAEKVHSIIARLHELGDPVKADDLTSRIKSLREDAVRQLRDRQELFGGGEDIIRLGRFGFTVNPQTLEITIVPRRDRLYFHLSGTNFYEPVQDDFLNLHRAMWDQLLVSENSEVYRAEYLAYTLLRQAGKGNIPAVAALAKMSRTELLKVVQKEMSTRFNEGYAKGIHDEDATSLLERLTGFYVQGGMVRYNSSLRARTVLFWLGLEEAYRAVLADRLKGLGLIHSVFEDPAVFEDSRRELAEKIGLHYPGLNKGEAMECAAYLTEEVAFHADFILSHDARQLAGAFRKFLSYRKKSTSFEASLKHSGKQVSDRFSMALTWLKAFAASTGAQDAFVEEAAVYLVSEVSWRESDLEMRVTVNDLKGTHRLIGNGEGYTLHFNDFLHRLHRYSTVYAEQFRELQAKKQALTQTFAEDLRLQSFKPRVMTSFVRNRLINEVYLPLIGANLAKQIGEAGTEKRTDLMGLLLLVSPPGYGKTTLMEYIANRLGLVFMKINGPALGHAITSVDPQLAPGATARQELEKLNLAFEMGDNVMIYLDDIQHLNPEFLQKFISLCDAQRKIEGVYKGKSKTYDFRGRKVCVVMAGNPYTESGEKFRIPDMLSNRADIYNLGDIIGDSEEAFRLSYLENCITSNQVLGKLAGGSQQDIYALIAAAGKRSLEGLDLEGNYSQDELAECYEVLIRLFTVRDVIMQVNNQYVSSAAQADAYRTEPPFKLQGSYRDMNKIAEKVYPVMNEEELKTLIRSHYENEAQSLTSGAEANLLKFREINGWLTPELEERWNYILERYRQDQKRKGYGENQAVGQLVEEIEGINKGLVKIENAIRKPRDK